MADIGDIQTNERTVEIKHPGTGENLGIAVTITHIDDERLQKVKRAVIDQRLKLEQKGKTFSAKEIEENKIRILIAAITDWRWYNPTGEEGDEGYNSDAMPLLNGEVPAFTERNVKIILTTPKYFWFVEQIDEAVGETEVFFNA